MRGMVMVVAAMGLWMAACGAEEKPAEDTAAVEMAAAEREAAEDAHSDALSAKIKEGKEGLYTCGSAEKAGGEAVYGKVTATFEIKADGTIGKLAIEDNSTANEQVATCVLDTIKVWTFPPHPFDESIEYTYPFEVGF